MTFTNEQIEAIKEAALPIEYGSLTIQIGAAANYIDIDVHRKVRVKKEPTEKAGRKETMK